MNLYYYPEQIEAGVDEVARGCLLGRMYSAAVIWSNEDMNGEFSRNRIKNIWVNPAEKYLVINDKLRITNLHIIHVKRGDEYKFLPAEKAKIGDFLFTDSGDYEPIKTIEQIYEKTEVPDISEQ